MRLRLGSGSAAAADAREVGAISQCPLSPLATIVLGHGAGAGMRHPFMEALAAQLEVRRLATVRYQFPYMEAGGHRPDARPVLFETVRAAVAAASDLGEGRPVFAAGKSMGGRMSSLAAAEGMISVRGLVFYGFPLHPVAKPSTERSDHLARVDMPMLFLQGTRDALCDLTLLDPVIERLGARAQLRILDGADHGFHVLKRSGRTDEDVMSELGERTEHWVREILGITS